MTIKFIKPVTPSTRGLVQIDRKELWKGKPAKGLVIGKRSTGGRNKRGVITSRHRGGGHKKNYRLIDFKRVKDNIPAVVQRVEYDPNRTSFVALIKYEDGEESYILSPKGVESGDIVISGENVDILPGNCLPLRYIPVGSFVHNIELYPGNGGIISRSAGSFAQIIGKDGQYVLLRLRSGQIRMILFSCRATIGVLSNEDNKNVKLGKAGRSRWFGIRPTVRGVAMNPVDHPHGGGEGKTSGGRHPVTPWGVATKGKKTRKKGKSSDKYIRYKG